MQSYISYSLLGVVCAILLLALVFAITLYEITIKANASVFSRAVVTSESIFWARFREFMVVAMKTIMSRVEIEIGDKIVTGLLLERWSVINDSLVAIIYPKTLESDLDKFFIRLLNAVAVSGTPKLHNDISIVARLFTSGFKFV